MLRESIITNLVGSPQEESKKGGVKTTATAIAFAEP